MNLLMFPKDREAITKESNIIYWFKCHRTECDEEYIGESARMFEERYKEHLKALSPTFEHPNITCHTTTVENFKIIGREDQNMARAIKEAIYIRVNNPTLNRNIGKYNLPHIWGKVLFSISELKAKKYLSTITSVSQKVQQQQRTLHKNICALGGLTTIIDLCTETSVTYEVHNEIKIQ